MIIVLYGYSGSGKTTFAKYIESKLPNIKVIDEDESIYRNGILSSSIYSRYKKIINDAVKQESNGNIVIVCLKLSNNKCRDILNNLNDKIIYIHISTKIDICEQRKPHDIRQLVTYDNKKVWYYNKICNYNYKDLNIDLSYMSLSEAYIIIETLKLNKIYEKSRKS